MSLDEQVPIRAKEIRMVCVDDVVPNERNRNLHSNEQIKRLSEIIKYQGFRIPVVISKRSGKLVAGHGRLLAAKMLGLSEIPATFQDFESDEQEYAAGISDNSIGTWAELDLAGINLDIGDLGPDFNLDLLGIKDFVLEPADKFQTAARLADRFLVPPFSILDTRQGYWQERKRQWLALGIQSEIGRGGGMTYQDHKWQMEKLGKIQAPH